ncbi:MAG: SLC26A/SulP transporter family protein [Gammaproteobacteria bacterium]|nr:SLC26A/SulP transporter family protein [Gammaproteobacteria bacterium]
MPLRNITRTLYPDLMGGLSAMLVALPSSIAFGLIIFAPLGSAYLAQGALAGILGSIAIGLVAPILGGAPRLVSAPCAPAAAVLAAHALQLANTPNLKISPQIVLLALSLVGLFAAILQIFFGKLGGGKLIKFIPYPVVAGYLSAVGCIIILGQFHTFVGLPHDVSFFTTLTSIKNWQAPALIIGCVSLGVMFLAPRLTRKIPAPILAILAGIVVYFGLSKAYPDLTAPGNPWVIGPLDSVLKTSLAETATEKWQTLSSFPWRMLLSHLLFPALTLAVLLSIDTLKTCVILDTLTKTRHNSNRELFAQGCANMTSTLVGGMPGAGTLGATLVNVTGGGQTRLSGFFVGVFSLMAYLFLGPLFAVVPLAALSGILIAVGIRMIDVHSFHLLKQRATWLDFLVTLSVVITAILVNLMAAAGVGVLLAILLFLRNQILSSVIRRKTFGNTRFSKRKRLPQEIQILETYGNQTVIFELQGTLFFGTTDQLLTELEPTFKTKHFIILDLRRVVSIDFTAAHMLKHIDHLVLENGGKLLYCNLDSRRLPTDQTKETYLRYHEVIREAPHIKYCKDLNEALEWAEEAILEAHQVKRQELKLKVFDLQDFTLFKAFPDNILKELAAYTHAKIYVPNALIFESGSTGDELYLIRRGEVKITLPLQETSQYHIITFSQGDFFGELSFLDKAPRSANAIARTTVEVFTLSRCDFDRVATSYPAVTGLLLSQISQILVLRLRHADQSLRTLEEL